jgi:hypothetical protein
MPAVEKPHREAVVRELTNRRDTFQQQIATLQAKLRELNTAIATVSALDTSDSDPSPRAISTRPPSQKYANISVRWAILDFLNDSEPKATSEIAESIRAAGVQTRAANFTNNVSAVLSTNMKEQHKEVEQLPDGRWQLTEKGRQAITHIRSTPRFLRGCGVMSY